MFEKAGSGSRAGSSWGREKGGWEPMALSEEKLCSVGCKWMYTFRGLYLWVDIATSWAFGRGLK